MQCDFCNAKANVFLTQLIEGQMKKICLCDRCAEERGVTDPTGFSLADMLVHGSNIFGAKTPPFRQDHSARQCPNCGFSIEDLRKTRRFGCSDCYETYAGEIQQMLSGMHKGASHSGKIPGGLIARQIIHKRIEELKDRLAGAVSSESYEEAAKIRDEIRRVETEYEQRTRTE